MRHAILAVFMALTLIASPALGTATPVPGVNFTSEKAPNPTAVEDELTIVTHDRGEMNAPLEYYNDSGEITTLPATVNQSQDTPVGVGRPIHSLMFPGEPCFTPVWRPRMRIPPDYRQLMILLLNIELEVSRPASKTGLLLELHPTVDVHDFALNVLVL
jgi:hypothetical protein